MPARERFLKAYLDYLPTYDDYAQFHPLLRLSMANDYSTTTTTTTTTAEQQPQFFTDHLIHQLQMQLEHEYNVLCSATQSDSGQVIHISKHLHDTVPYIDYQDYVTARLHVHTRSFTAGALGQHDISHDELAVFGKHLTIDQPHLTSSSLSPLSSKDDDASSSIPLREALASAMVPLLDSFNHHAQPNIGWKYVVVAAKEITSNDDGGLGASSSPSNGFGPASTTTTIGSSSSGSSSNYSSFVVFATQDVPSGVPLFDTYGTTTTDSRYVTLYHHHLV